MTLTHFVLQVTCQGQIIGGIVAASQTVAQRAARLVKVEYEELKPIITIEVSMFLNAEKMFDRFG